MLYRGPVADLRSMRKIHEISTIPGLSCAIGPSTLGCGLGLFLVVFKPPQTKGIEQSAGIHVPCGSYICGYSDGEFHTKRSCDKTVRYTFKNIMREVFFRNQTVPLKEAIEYGSDLHSRAPGRVLNRRMLGHKIYLDCDDNLQVDEDPWYTLRNFSPCTSTKFDEISSSNLGCYINDFAFRKDLTFDRSTYNSHVGKNCLDLVWCLELDEERDMIVPDRPVIVTNKALVFDKINTPMEVGIEYGWDFWEYWRDSLRTNS